MGGKSEVEPDQQIMLLGQLKKAVEVLQLIFARLRFNLVPVGERFGTIRRPERRMSARSLSQNSGGGMGAR